MSYSRKDEQVMQRITKFLRKNGLNIWVDNEKLTPGTPIWQAEIEKSITRSKAVIVILSPSSKRSKWVAREIASAELYQKRIFPILVRGDPISAIPINLITTQFVDFRKDEDAGMENLKTALTSHLDNLKVYAQESKTKRSVQDKRVEDELDKIEGTQTKQETVQLENEKTATILAGWEKTKKMLAKKAKVNKARGGVKGTRLIYQYAINRISKEGCIRFIETLKTHVATDNSFIEKGYSLSLINDFYEFITTSRHTERWLQEIEDEIYKMEREKLFSELWMVIGGYGSGKSHIKHFLTRNNISNIGFFELDIATIMNTSHNSDTAIDNVFSFVLLGTKPYLNALYTSMKGKASSSSSRSINKTIKDELNKYSIDQEFANAFCNYGTHNKNDLSNFEPLEKIISQSGKKIFLPLMKLYKKYLGFNGISIFIDEFESLMHMSIERRDRFLESIRLLYDTTASTFPDPETPSFLTMIFCTISFWNEIERYSHSQALAERLSLFELTPLMEDEIIALAEKIYTLYKKSGYLNHEITLDFTKIFSYLVNIARIEHPLTPRFVIEQIIRVIENPEEFIGSLSSRS